MRKAYHFWVYIVTNPERTVLYTGMANDLARRLTEHYENRGTETTFAGKYYCYNLVHYEYTNYVLNAIEREKEIKDQSRAKKEALIARLNPDWIFLNAIVCGAWPPRPLAPENELMTPPQLLYPNSERIIAKKK